MIVMKMICNWIDRLNTWIGQSVAWVTLLLVITVFSDVVMRYLFNTSFVFVQELEWHLFAFIFLMGAGYTLLKDGHVRVDIIYQRLSPKASAWVNVVGIIFFLFPGCIMIIITSISFFSSSYHMMECSPDPGGIPYRCIIKSTIPIGFFLVALQGLSMFLKNLMIIFSSPIEED
ncbi:C4-dicarboxylate ABC transporter permease [Candidatus Magnetomorum sp. HK-1]|nr:C4-dicarboxylate ABC transporter permease [Candidatus Magnetomorum sp. HK-1]